MPKSEIHKSELTDKKYILNKRILKKFESAGDPFSQEVEIKEYIFNLIISKHNWLERIEQEPNVLNFCIESGLLKEIKV